MGELSGLTLSRRFYEDLVAPRLAAEYPALRHAAALIGYGSEVLGLDTPMSRDHNFGPRVLLFVEEAEFHLAPAILRRFEAVLPDSFLGEPVGFRSRPHAPPDEPGALGVIGHGLEVHTLGAWLRRHLGLGPDGPAQATDWLGVAEQHLLEFTAGAVFRDDVGRLTALRERLAWYPQDVWLYRLAAQWARIAEERAFVGRTGDVGDELGSRVIAARLARDLMRLAFLVERRYAPYAKWFGTAFQRLACAPQLTPPLAAVLSAEDWREREGALAEAARRLAQLQLAREIPGAPAPAVGRDFERPFHGLKAAEIAAGFRGAIADPQLRARPLFGAVDQVSDSTPLLDDPAASRAVASALFPDRHP